MNIKDIEGKINKIPDYPKPGILFYDISSLIIHGEAFLECTRLLIEAIKKYDFNSIAAIDARGFIFGSAIAQKLGLGMVMIRKKGKLPGKIISHSYSLEYGTDTLEINVEANEKKFILIDDLLATGGTAAAAVELIKKSGGTVSCFLALIELTFLNGNKKIDAPIETLIRY